MCPTEHLATNTLTIWGAIPPQRFKEPHLSLQI
jgi:hypothetical protein